MKEDKTIYMYMKGTEPIVMFNELSDEEVTLNGLKKISEISYTEFKSRLSKKLKDMLGGF
ncbi:hypothetical protein [Listeria booriae]|uniref:hypothetical protein n=1 Tax=Listeria booriae TaxID=1552123 RepID=UPI001628CBC7|nr:hypothetical protein [Listeria booriae]MBC2196290.1 hypothetical protein [Listeria booriae]